ncbi:MAG TPA: DUF4249 domain-containing protein [Puia sp.]|nr:DUF4249 domain-containing protein [Puia sp.]
MALRSFTIPALCCCTWTTIMIGCRRPYDPPAIQAPNNYLVVDGFINTGAGTITRFNLGRSVNLGDTATTGTPEIHATMAILGSGGASYPLVDSNSTGTYASAPLNLDITQQYSITITTSDGQKYASDPVPCRQPPAIDSIFWRQPDDLTVYLASHDPANTTRYYRFDYSGTYEHDSNLESPWQAVNGILIAADSTNQHTRCWSTENSKGVLITTTTALSQDRVSAFPLVTFPNGDSRIDIGYSILVRQYAITGDAYNYWLQIQKTTDNLGTLFDVQPVQLVGNIRCLTNPTQPVIGYLSASSVQQQRIMIWESYMSRWQHNSPAYSCDTVSVPYIPNDFPAYNYPNEPGYGPYYFNGFTILVLAPLICLDCTQFGGTTIKPPFWP